LTQRYRDQPLAYDIALHLALIQIEKFDGSLAWIEFADSERVVVRDQLYALVIPSRAASIRLFFLKCVFSTGKGALQGLQTILFLRSCPCGVLPWQPQFALNNNFG
jgi:hypothetical protein